MKNLINTAIVSLALLISNYALANFQDGLDAYNKQDYTATFKEWQPLAKQGNADAQNNLGAMYANGKGTSKDAKQAVYWYKKAAEQGYAGAQYNLGVMYANGFQCGSVVLFVISIEPILKIRQGVIANKQC
jgi:TPR repeat protein